MANDNFNLSKADVAAIGGTFQESARIDRKRREREEEKRDGGGFFSRLGMGLASGVVQQAVVEPITESVAGFINRPFADRENVFLKSIDTTVQAENLTRERARTSIRNDTKLADRGLNEQEKAVASLIPNIENQLRRAVRSGKLPDNLRGNVTLGELTEDTNILRDIAEQIAFDSVTANDNEGVKAYTAHIEAGKRLDLSSAGDAAHKKNRLSYNNLSQNWVEKGINILRNRSPEDLIDMAAKKYTTDERYQQHLVVQNAVKNWGMFKNAEAMEELTTATAIGDTINEMDDANFIEKTRTVGTDTYVAKDGPFAGEQVERRGVWVSKYDILNGTHDTKFYPSAEPARRTTTAAQRLKLMGAPETAISNLKTQGISSDAIKQLYKELALITDNNGSPINIVSYLSYAGQEGIEDKIALMHEKISAMRLNENNYKEGYNTALRERTLKALGTRDYELRVFRNSLKDMDEAEQFIEMQKWHAQRSRTTATLAAVDANLIDTDKYGNGIAKGWKLDEDNLPTEDPDAGLTVAQYAVNSDMFDAWRKGNQLPSEEIESRMTNIEYGDELLFKKIDGVSSIFNSETGEYSPIAVVAAEEVASASDRVDVKDVLKLPVPPVKEGLEIERWMSGKEISAVKTARALYRNEYIEYQKQLEEFKSILLEVNPRPENLGKTGRGTTVGSRSSSEQWDRRNKNLRKTGLVFQGSGDIVAQWKLRNEKLRKPRKGSK